MADYLDVDYRDPSLTALANGLLLLSYVVSDGQTGAVIQTQVNVEVNGVTGHTRRRPRRHPAG